MTRPLPAPRQRETAPGVSRRVFFTALGIALALFAGMLTVTLVVAQNIVNDATDGLCLLVRDTPDSVDLAQDIRAKYNCPAYKATGTALTLSPTSTVTPTRSGASALPSRPTATTSGVAGTRSATPRDGSLSATTRERTTVHTQVRTQRPAPRTVTRAGPTKTQPAPSRPTTPPGVLGSLCQLVGIKVACSSLGLN